jgi:hypothetical protein
VTSEPRDDEAIEDALSKSWQLDGKGCCMHWDCPMISKFTINNSVPASNHKHFSMLVTSPQEEFSFQGHCRPLWAQIFSIDGLPLAW